MAVGWRVLLENGKRASTCMQSVQIFNVFPDTDTKISLNKRTEYKPQKLILDVRRGALKQEQNNSVTRQRNDEHVPSTKFT